MVFRQCDGGIAEESSQTERPTCHICQSAGPFGDAMECTAQLEKRRHRYVLCKSSRCKAKFEKECVAAAEKGVEAKNFLRIKQMAKKGSFFCPKCFKELQDVPVPESHEVAEDLAPPPPPTRKASKDNLPSAEDSSSTPKAEPTLNDVDFSECVAHVKESLPDASPGGAVSKKGKKGKKQGNQLQRELVNALFFDNAAPQATEEGELIRSPSAWTSPPAQARQSPPALLPAPTLPAAERLGVWADRPVSQADELARYASQRTSAQPKVEMSKPSAGTGRATESAKPTGLPPGWRSAWDPESNQHYFYHIETKEVTWDCPSAGKPHQQEEATSSVSTTPSQGSTVASVVCSQASTAPSVAQYGSLEYVCVHTWKPRDEDKGCIRLIQGDRVVLESETLSGWGIGTVVPEKGEAQQCGHFPRWALSNNPAPEPELFPQDSRVTVCQEFAAPAGGYLPTCPGEVLVAKYQVAPYVWVWVEDPADPSRRGWAPEAVLRLT